MQAQRHDAKQQTLFFSGKWFNASHQLTGAITVS